MSSTPFLSHLRLSAFLCGLFLFLTQTAAQTTVTIHYHRPAGDYEGWNAWVWPEGGPGQAAVFEGVDAFGPWATVRLDGRPNRVGFLLRRGEWEEKDVEQDRFIPIGEDGKAEVWLKQGDPRVHTDPKRVRYTPREPVAQPSLAPPPPPDAGQLRRVAPRSAQEVGAAGVLVVHYHRPDARYGGWDVWAWAEGEPGRAFPLRGEDAFGRYATIELPSPTQAVGFLIRRSDWSAREVGGDRRVTLDGRGVAEVWAVAGDRALYTDPATIDFRPKVVAAFLDRPDRVRVRLSQAAPAAAFAAEGVTLTIGGTPARVAAVEPVGATLFGAEAWDVTLAEPVTPLQLPQPMALVLPGYAEATVRPRDVLADTAYDAAEARLGYEYALSATTFRTWSPVAERVELLLFPGADATEPSRTIPLARGRRGVWEVVVGGDLHGTHYAYRFHVAGSPRDVADVHGFAATADSKRSLVLDLRRTDPAGFRDHAPPVVASPTDEVIYELHVRDFSIRDDRVPAAHRGKYLGLTHETGTTSLSYLKSLGVTTVHLLPIQDFDAPLDEYNWGYWTALFNVPEAQYSTNPHDPAQTIRELKQTIQALHAAGIRVVMDVVYNHTSTSFESSPFDQAVPWHYFRSDDDGTLRNESGTGNAFADERPMARKYIIDSLRFWAEEYKVDGFRFDLVGMHQPETVRAIERELHAVRTDLLLYGEPWTGGGPTHFPKGAQRGMRFAVFNDHLRNALRGDLDGTAQGFVINGSHADAVRRGVAASLDDFTDSPIETINYVSAHDNLTLWDKLTKAMPAGSDAERLGAQKLALGIVLTAQGVPFLHGGSEFARTKRGEHNSYNLGDEINAYDWERAARVRPLYDYVRGLIALRKEHPAFRLSTATQVRQHLSFLPTQDVVAFTLDGAATGDPWRTILVAYNGQPTRQTLQLPKGVWQVAVDDERVTLGTLGTVRGQVALPGRSMVVLYQE